jgi:addiction module HigA family antidote
LKSWITTAEKEDIMARTAIHPGEHLAEELRELGMSAAELARQIDVPVNRITQIINGQRAVTADSALRLGHWFNTGPEVWLNPRQLYELWRAQAEIGAAVERLPVRGEGMAAAQAGLDLGVSTLCPWQRSTHSAMSTPPRCATCSSA